MSTPSLKLEDIGTYFKLYKARGEDGRGVVFLCGWTDDKEEAKAFFEKECGPGRNSYVAIYKLEYAGPHTDWEQL